MKNIKLGKLWDSLHSSYWFVPTIMAIVAVGLAFTMLNFDRAINRLFPERIGINLSERKHQITEIPINFDSEACPIKANDKGYIQAIDEEKLMQIACEQNLILRIQSRPGKFVFPGRILIMVWSGEYANQKLTEQINDAFIIDGERTEQQDIEFPIEQLVEIALRAISPGINDPFTAIRCIDRLSAGLSQLAQRNFPSPYRYDDQANLRVIADSVKFPGLLDAAFNQIRQYGQKDVAVMIRLMEAIALIATYASNTKDRAALRRHAEMILQSSQKSWSEEQDCKDIQERYYQVIKALGQE